MEKGELNVIFFFIFIRLKRKRKKKKKKKKKKVVGVIIFLFKKKKKKLALIKKEGTSTAIQLPRNGGNSSIQTCVQSTVQHSTMKV